MSAYKAMCDRQTENAIIVTFSVRSGEWIGTVLYDSRKTPHDIPVALHDYPVESINITNDLTIIEV